MTAAASDVPTPISTGELLTRKQFSKLVGASEWELRSLHQAGIFEAYAKGKSGRGHAALYHVDQVSEFRARATERASRRPHEVILKSAFTSEQAQACFKAFDDGWTLRRCVIELGFHPDVVTALRGAYEKLDQGVFLSHGLLDRANATMLDGPMPLQSGEDVVVVLEKAAARIEALVERTAEKTTCASPSCKSAAAYCPACVANTIAQVREEGAAEGRAEKAKGAKAEASAPSATRPPAKGGEASTSPAPGARAPDVRSPAARRGPRAP